MMISGTFKVVGSNLVMQFESGETIVHDDGGRYFIRKTPDSPMEYALGSTPLWDLIDHIRLEHPDQP